MHNKLSLSNQARETAQYLVHAWDKGIIESYFTLIDVTAGADTSVQTVPGLGVLKPDEFKVPPLANIMELRQAGLIQVESNETRGRKWDVQLLQPLREAVANNFGERDEQIESASPRLFISYSRKDITLRRLLQDKLSETYPHTRSDERFLFGSERWWAEILDEIEACDIFIFLISPDSIESLFCRAEFSEAVRLQKQIVPIIVHDTTTIPVVVSDYQYVNLLDWASSEQIYGGIFTALERASSRVSSSSSDPLWRSKSPRPKTNNRLDVPANKDPKDSEIELNTGILLLPGDRVTISAMGTITFDGAKTPSDPSGIIRHANGIQQPFPQEDAYRTKNPPSYATHGYGLIGSLIGWIGNGNYAGNAAYFIGANQTIEVQPDEQGFLFLAVNDARGTYGDNEGEYEVHITVDRV